MELAKPIYEAWACDVSSQWHRTKALTRRQPNTKRKKKLDLLSFSFIFYFFAFYFILVILLYSFFFYFNIEDNVVFKVWGYWENFDYFFCVKKKHLCLIFLNSYWFIRIRVLFMRINWDRWRYKSNEWLCMQVLMFNWLRDWLWKYVMLTL
jgi:hypothetical protein